MLVLSIALKSIRGILFILGITISLLTTAMSYDASRIGADSLATAQTVQVTELGDMTTASVDISIQNNGYLFSLYDAKLTINILDERYGQQLGTGSEIITVDPGERFSRELRIPMVTSEYQNAGNINVTVTLEGNIALKLSSTRITFVSFTLTSSEVANK